MVLKFSEVKPVRKMQPGWGRPRSRPVDYSPGAGNTDRVQTYLREMEKDNAKGYHERLEWEKFTDSFPLGCGKQSFITRCVVWHMLHGHIKFTIHDLMDTANKFYPNVHWYAQSMTYYLRKSGLAARVGKGMWSIYEELVP